MPEVDPPGASVFILLVRILLPRLGSLPPGLRKCLPLVFNSFSFPLSRELRVRLPQPRSPPQAGISGPRLLGLLASVPTYTLGCLSFQ